MCPLRGQVGNASLQARPLQHCGTNRIRGQRASAVDILGCEGDRTLPGVCSRRMRGRFPAPRGPGKERASSRRREQQRLEPASAGPRTRRARRQSPSSCRTPCPNPGCGIGSWRSGVASGAGHDHTGVSRKLVPCRALTPPRATAPGGRNLPQGQHARPWACSHVSSLSSGRGASWHRTDRAACMAITGALEPRCSIIRRP